MNTRDTNEDRPRLEEEASAGTSRTRSRVVRALICLCFAALTVQLWRLQIVDGRVHSAAARENSLRVLEIPALRGIIYDRNFEALAINAPTFVVSVTEADLPVNGRAGVFEETARILGTTAEELERTLQAKRDGSGPFAPVVVKTNVPRDLALMLEQQSWALPGVYVAVDATRQYVDGPVFSHFLGYTGLPSPEEFAQRYEREGYHGDERVGLAGIEKVYEADMHGRPGGRMIEADVGGRPLKERERKAPLPGRALVLSVDAPLQRAAHRILNDRLEAQRQVLGRKPEPPGLPAPAGAAVVMDPRNGEMLSMVSLPGYDANVFYAPDRDTEIQRLLSDRGLPLFNRAVDGLYPPGSTFKLVTGIGALEEGTANRNTSVNCDGGLNIPNPYVPGAFTRLPDWGVMGILGFVQGLAQSCNVYFYTLGGGFGSIEGLGNARLARYGRMLGYGEATGIDLPSEGVGRVPTIDWKQANIGEAWVPGDTYNMAIGQGFVLATPLQVAMVTNAIAMGGVAYRPHLVRAIVDGERRPTRDVVPELARRIVLKPETLAVIREGMVAVLDTPQARGNTVPGVQVAGKTGTAEFAGTRDQNGNLPTHGWFTAFAPAHNPRVSVTVFLERGGGPTDALPLAMDILREYFKLYP